MNHFFLMLWLADVVDNITPLTVILTIGWLLTLIGFGCWYGCALEHHRPEVVKKNTEKVSNWLKLWFKHPLRIVIALLIMNFLTPSSTTVRMMAAADLTGKAITSLQQSQIGQKALQALNVELDKVIKDK